MKELKQIKFWLFDLDNTLYSGDTKVFDQVDKKIVQGGMIPKLLNSIDAIENGVKGVVIIDGRKLHSILYEIFSDEGAGTLIRK